MNIVNISIKDIIPYANNPRKNTKAVDTVVDSINQYGFQQPIVVDKNNIIIVGHTRYLAAKKLGLNTVPVTKADTLTEDQVKAYRIMDNRSNENAHWDDGLLFDELKLLLKNDDITQLSEVSGFTEKELHRLFNKENIDQNKLEKILQSKTKPRSRVGDIWTLGDHKIINGSSVDKIVIDQLLNNTKINPIWEDPPYGITYRSVTGVTNSKEVNDARDHIIANDTLNKDELCEFLDIHLKLINQYIEAACPIYWCHDIRTNNIFQNILVKNNFHISDVLIWRKTRPRTFLCDYWKFYEPIIYGWKKGSQHPWYGGSKENPNIQMDNLKDLSKEELIDIINSYSNVQTVEKEIIKLHPTVKPIRLIANHIINSTKKGDIVFDGFGGSGSTLIACEKLNRKARLCEIEPKFVDVTIMRWQDLTGCEAINQHGIKWNSIVSDNMSAMEEFFEVTDEPRS